MFLEIASLLTAKRLAPRDDIMFTNMKIKCDMLYSLQLPKPVGVKFL